jgi:hypothetical protein
VSRPDDGCAGTAGAKGATQLSSYVRSNYRTDSCAVGQCQLVSCGRRSSAVQVTSKMRHPVYLEVPPGPVAMLAARHAAARAGPTTRHALLLLTARSGGLNVGLYSQRALSRPT